MRQRRMPLPSWLISTALAASGCGGGDSGVPASQPETGPTFHAEVEPLLEKHCTGCHAPGRIAPFSLTTYDAAKAVAQQIASSTREGTMPPWGAWETEECQPRFGWKNDLRLSEQEIATLSAWAEAGAPEGDPSGGAAPPAIEPAEDGLPGADLEVSPVAPFVASGDADVFRCFVMDPKLTETRYMNGAHVLAGNTKVVHHALVYLDAQGDSAALADAEGGYDCFGGPGVGGQLIAVWAPGSTPMELEQNVGVEIPAGSRLVMQVHYHPAGTTAEPDTTRFQMRFADAPPDYQLFIELVGNKDRMLPNGDGLLPGPNDEGGVEFRIPADAKGHIESMITTVSPGSSDVYLYGASPHMHYLGTDMKIELERTTPAEDEPASECLVQDPAWNFSWQRNYYYDAPIESLPRVGALDRLKLRCTYDNSLDNTFLVKALKEQRLTSPVDVRLGEGTLDEMCIAVLPFVVPRR